MEGIQSQCPRIWTGLLQRCVCSSVYSIGSLITYVTAQSFLLPQSPDMVELKPAVYVLKHILHDWSDSYCHQMLKHLHDATAHSGEKPTLLVIDFIVSLACHTNEGDPDNDDFRARQEIPGVYQPSASPPLLANWGYAAAFPYSADLNVCSPFTYFVDLSFD